jgi:hypothetical protein
MSGYHLSEAYSNLYNSRQGEDFSDNLRFIDYMLDEDIEEVVESLFWEFRDYGNSIDESIDLLRSSTSTEVINESLDFLTEARYTDKQLKMRADFKAKQQKDTESVTAGKDKKIRQDKRKARIDGAISNCKPMMFEQSFNVSMATNMYQITCNLVINTLNPKEGPILLVFNKNKVG